MKTGPARSADVIVIQSGDEEDLSEDEHQRGEDGSVRSDEGVRQRQDRPIKCVHPPQLPLIRRTCGGGSLPTSEQPQHLNESTLMPFHLRKSTKQALMSLYRSEKASFRSWDSKGVGRH